MQITEENMPEGLTARDLLLVERYDRLIKTYEPRVKAIKARINAALGKGTHSYRHVIIKRTVARVTDKDSIAEAYPYEKYPEYYTTPVLDLKRVPEAIKDQYKVDQNRVSISSAK